MSVFLMTECMTGEVDARLDAEHLEDLGNPSDHDDTPPAEIDAETELGHFGTGSDETDACLGTYGFNMFLEAERMEPEPQQAPPPRQRQEEDDLIAECDGVYNVIRKIYVVSGL